LGKKGKMLPNGKMKCAIGGTSMKLEDRMTMSINSRAGNVILRSDVAKLGSSSQVSEVLRSLQDKKALVRIAIGVYAKARPDPDTGDARVSADLKSLTNEALSKLGKSAWLQEWHEASGQEDRCWYVYISEPHRRISKKFSLGNQQVLFVNAHDGATIPDCMDTCENQGHVERSIPSKNVRQYIIRLAKRHHVAYANTVRDNWANAVTRLAGDEVRQDPVKDLLIALKRAGKVSTNEMAALLINYLRENKSVRSVQGL
jgi:hypothetical protein